MKKRNLFICILPIFLLSACGNNTESKNNEQEKVIEKSEALKAKNALHSAADADLKAEKSEIVLTGNTQAKLSVTTYLNKDFYVGADNLHVAIQTDGETTATSFEAETVYCRDFENSKNAKYDNIINSKISNPSFSMYGTEEKLYIDKTNSKINELRDFFVLNAISTVDKRVDDALRLIEKFDNKLYFTNESQDEIEGSISEFDINSTKKYINNFIETISLFSTFEVKNSAYSASFSTSYENLLKIINGYETINESSLTSMEDLKKSIKDLDETKIISIGYTENGVNSISGDLAFSLAFSTNQETNVKVDLPDLKIKSDFSLALKTTGVEVNAPSDLDSYVDGKPLIDDIKNLFEDSSESENEDEKQQ